MIRSRPRDSVTNNIPNNRWLSMKFGVKTHQPPSRLLKLSRNAVLLTLSRNAVLLTLSRNAVLLTPTDL